MWEKDFKILISMILHQKIRNSKIYKSVDLPKVHFCGNNDEIYYPGTKIGIGHL